MSFSLTKRARQKAERNNITPNMVLTIDGITDKFGAVTIKKYIRVGDTDLVIDGTWVIGGLRAITDQQTLISFDGTTTNINQKMDIDKGSGSSVSQMNVALVDIDGAALELVSPGVLVPDIMGRKCVVSIGFADTAWPDDYIKVFRGIVDQVRVGPGKVTFQISHPDQKKRQDIFLKASAALTADIGPSDTTIFVDTTANFMTRVMGPDGTYDPNIQFGLIIDEEVIFYTGTTGTSFTGCTRGGVVTAPVMHANEASITSFVRVMGNGLDIALKVMLSTQGDFVDEVDITHFNQLTDGTPVTDAIYFQGINVFDEYGIVINDYITTVDSAFPENNVTLAQITDVVAVEDGSYIVVDGAGFVAEPDSPATIAFRSQYDTFPEGASLGLNPFEVDVTEHNRIKRLFLSSFDLDFYLRETINGTELIEKEIYLPGAAYSIPRKSQVSVGYTIGPLPNNEVKIFDDTNSKKASQLSLNRGVSKNFYNTIVYRYEELPGEAKFIRGTVTQDAQSLEEIDVGTRALIITSKGMRESLSGANISAQASSRRLKRYKRGAEYIDNFEVAYGDSFNVEIGDIIVLDNSALKIADTKNNTREGEPKLYEIQNKAFDVKTGTVKLSLVDTNYSTNSRYCLMSPSSDIEVGASTTVFKVRKTGNSVFGINEGKKWDRYLGAAVRVRSSDFTTRNDTSFIQSVSGNTITLSPALSFIPQLDDAMTLTHYDDMTDTLKLVYGWMRNFDFFADGKKRYEMIG